VVVVSYSGKEINAKLVYYGAGLSGKTTNLEAIYEAVPDTSRGKMVSMKTQSDRTLFFDLLPLDLGEIMGFKTRFLLYTVPGQVFYNATRKLVLKGADAIVFVADSEVGKMEENKESLANLRTNLAEYGLTLDSIPWVIQYNKRDLPNVYTVDELNAELNPMKVPSFEAVASEGKGVFETFRGVSHLLMEKVTKDLRRSPSTPARPVAAPAAEEPAHRGPATLPPSMPPPPAPVAPVQAIRSEAQGTPAPVAGSDTSRYDYGEEIDLPSPPRDGARPAPAVVSEPVTTTASAHEAMRSVPLPRPSATMPRPAMTPSPAAPAPVSVNSHPAHTAPAAAAVSEVKQIVVPVKLPPGGSYEIIIKLQLDTNA
jgi:signal recognition particle receptor subunit beta